MAARGGGWSWLFVMRMRCEVQYIYKTGKFISEPDVQRTDCSISITAEVVNTNTSLIVCFINDMKERTRHDYYNARVLYGR